MKKIVVITFIIFTLVGCNSNNNLSEKKKLYQEMLKRLEVSTNDHFMKPLLFDINIYVDKVIDSEIMYRVIIDNPKEEIKKISALVVHNYPTSDIFPSIGIFDSKVNLIPNYIDVNNNYVKGITLVGYIPYNGDINLFNGEFKVIVEYEDNLGNIKNDYYIYQN